MPSRARRSATAAARRRAAARAPPGSRSLALLELFQMLQIEAVELFTYLEEEHAEDKHGDEYVERDAQLDHHRHPVGGAGRSEEQPVLHRQESDDLRNRLAAGDHHQEGQHYA